MRQSLLAKGHIPDESIDGWITMPSSKSAPNAEHRARIPIRYTNVRSDSITAEVHPDFHPKGASDEEIRKLKAQPIVLAGEELEKHRRIAREIDPEKAKRADPAYFEQEQEAKERDARLIKDLNDQHEAQQREHARLYEEALARDERTKAQEKAERHRKAYDQLVTSTRNRGGRWNEADAFGQRFYKHRTPAWSSESGKEEIEEKEYPRNYPFRDVPWDEDFGFHRDDRFERDPHKPGMWRLKGEPTLDDRPWELDKYAYKDAVKYETSARTPEKERLTRAVDHATEARDEAVVDVARVFASIMQYEKLNDAFTKAVRHDVARYDDLWERVHQYGQYRNVQPTEGLADKLDAARATVAKHAQKLWGSKALTDAMRWSPTARGDLERHLGEVRDAEAKLHEATQARTQWEAANPDPVSWEDLTKQAVERGEKLSYATAKRLWSRFKSTDHAWGPAFQTYRDAHAVHPADAMPEQLDRINTGWETAHPSGRAHYVQLESPFSAWSQSSVEAPDRVTAAQKVQAQIREKLEAKPAAVPNWLALEHPDHAEALGKILRIEGDGDNPSVKHGAAALAKFPPALLKSLHDYGAMGIHIGHLELNELDDLGYLADVKKEPKPWDDRASWAEVGGVYSGKTRTANTATLREQMTPDRAAHVMLHEVGHLIGDVHGLNDHEELVAAHTRLVKAKRLRPYFHRTGEGDEAGRHELLAEGFADLLGKGAKKAMFTYDRPFVRFLQRHLARFGGPAVPPATPADIPFTDYATPERIAEAKKMLESRMRGKIVRRMEDELKAHEWTKIELADEARDHRDGWESQWDLDAHAARVAQNAENIAEATRALKAAKRRTDFMPSDEDLKASMLTDHNDWMVMADLETGETEIGSEDVRTPLTDWADLVEKHSVDPELVKRVKALRQRVKF